MEIIPPPIPRLAIEIKYRIHAMRQIKQREHRDGVTIWAGTGRRTLDTGLPGTDIYPEFRDRSLLSLLWALMPLCSSVDYPKLKEHIRIFTTELPGCGGRFSVASLERAVKALECTIDLLY